MTQINHDSYVAALRREHAELTRSERKDERDRIPEVEAELKALGEPLVPKAHRGEAADIETTEAKPSRSRTRTK